MTTTKKTNEGAKVGRRSSRVNSRTNKVQSNNINTSAVADVVADVLPSGSVDVLTIEGESGLQSGVVSVPAAVGLSDGVAVPDGGALSSGCDGSDCGRKGTGRNNSADQTDLAFELDAKANEEEKQKKEDTLYNKVVARFTAPAFDRNKYAAPLIAEGLELTDIIARVNDARKEWENSHPAPVCDVARVLAVCVSDYAKEFVDVVGIHPTNIKVSDVRVYSRPSGCLCARPLDVDASASAVVRAVLSYRFKVDDDDAIRKAAFARSLDYHNKLDDGLFAGIEMNYDDERILEDCRRRLESLRRRESSEVATLRENFMKVRARLDAAITEVLAVCPSVAVARLGVNDDVFVLPDNITKEQRAVCGSQFSKIRGYRRSLTAINAKLWGVSVVL